MLKQVLWTTWLVAAPFLAATAGSDPGLPAMTRLYLRDLFRQSDMFTEKSHFLWADYQAFSNRGSRPYLSAEVIPPLGLGYERRLFHNFGLRIAAATHWWDEDRLRVSLPERQLFLQYRYTYWTLGVGLSYHFAINYRWDPYIALQQSFRLATASCECESFTESVWSSDFLFGLRYFASHRFYLLAEGGQHGVGYAKIGLGIKLY